jgi:hypothetical protein
MTRTGRLRFNQWPRELNAISDIALTLRPEIMLAVAAENFLKLSVLRWARQRSFSVVDLVQENVVRIAGQHRDVELAANRLP